MLVKHRISLRNIIDELSLKSFTNNVNFDEIYIETKNVSRPGLELTGFLNYFDKERLLIFGNTEMAFLSKFSDQECYNALEQVFSLGPPAILITRGRDPLEQMKKLSKLYNIPLLGTDESTSSIIASLVYFLNLELAQRITQHGVLVEVYGEGVLITGDSGIGKSEAAIELIKRGHRLIADDSIEIRRISNHSLVGTSPENIRHFIELRGIGIINARRIFGMGAVKLKENIDLEVHLELWNNHTEYDRIGVESEFTEILGVKVPIARIPVKPGRNLAIIIEIAAMNNRQKKMGYNAARELLASLGMGYCDDEFDE